MHILKFLSYCLVHSLVCNLYSLGTDISKHSTNCIMKLANELTCTLADAQVLL